MVGTKEESCTAGIPGPSVLTGGNRFLVKIAESENEVRAAQLLRYRIFREEQGRLKNCRIHCDRDEFDCRCAHLLVVDKNTASVLGTARLHFGKNLPPGGGFYSEQEFRFSGLTDKKSQILEVGRSCVAPQWRNGAVVALLWAGIAEVRRRMRFDYMLGCASLEQTDFSLARGIYRKMVEKKLVTSSPHGAVRRAYHLLPSPSMVLDDEKFQAVLPPLLKGYLRLGAKICGEPAFDRKFGSIDFPVWFDFINLPEKYCRHFKV